MYIGTNSLLLSSQAGLLASSLNSSLNSALAALQQASIISESVDKGPAMLETLTAKALTEASDELRSVLQTDELGSDQKPEQLAKRVVEEVIGSAFIDGMITMFTIEQEGYRPIDHARRSLIEAMHSPIQRAVQTIIDAPLPLYVKVHALDRVRNAIARKGRLKQHIEVAETLIAAHWYESALGVLATAAQLHLEHENPRTGIQIASLYWDLGKHDQAHQILEPTSRSALTYYRESPTYAFADAMALARWYDERSQTEQLTQLIQDVLEPIVNYNSAEENIAFNFKVPLAAELATSYVWAGNQERALEIINEWIEIIFSAKEDGRYKEEHFDPVLGALDTIIDFSSRNDRRFETIHEAAIQQIRSRANQSEDREVRRWAFSQICFILKNISPPSD